MLATDCPVRLALASCVCLLTGGALSAQDITLAPSDPPAIRFGSSVSICGNTAVVGAMNATNEGEPSAGSAYVFVDDGASWSEQAKIVPSDPGPEDLFGWSVSIDGDTVVVGSILDDNAAGENAGSAYVFVRTGGVWTQQAKLVADDARSNDRFGSSVAIFGDTVVVGVPQDDGPTGLDSGSAYVFVRTGTAWDQQAKLVANDARDTDRFGTSVSISGESVLVGTPGDRTGAPNPAGGADGSAYVFVRSGTVWTQQANLVPNPASGDSSVLGGRVAQACGGSHHGFGAKIGLEGGARSRTGRAEWPGSWSTDRFGMPRTDLEPGVSCAVTYGGLSGEDQTPESAVCTQHRLEPAREAQESMDDEPS